MRTIRMTKEVSKEIATAIATAVCGHPPDKLSPAAARAYKKMKDCDFKFNAVVDGVPVPNQEAPKLKSPKDV